MLAGQASLSESEYSRSTLSKYEVTSEYIYMVDQLVLTTEEEKRRVTSTNGIPTQHVWPSRKRQGCKKQKEVFEGTEINHGLFVVRPLPALRQHLPFLEP